MCKLSLCMASRIQRETGTLLPLYQIWLGVVVLYSKYLYPA